MVHTAANQHEKVAENYIRDLNNCIRCIKADLDDQYAPFLVPFIVDHAIRSLNHRIVRGGHASRWQIIMRKEDDGSELREFGAFVLAKQPEARLKDKLEYRNVVCVW